MAEKKPGNYARRSANGKETIRNPNSNIVSRSATGGGCTCWPPAGTARTTGWLSRARVSLLGGYDPPTTEPAAMAKIEDLLGRKLGENRGAPPAILCRSNIR